MSDNTINVYNKLYQEVFDKILLYDLNEFNIKNSRVYQFTHELVGPSKFDRLKHGYKNALVSLKSSVICVHYQFPYLMKTLSLKTSNGVYAFFKKPNSQHFTKNQREVVKEGFNYINMYGFKFNIYNNQFNLPKHHEFNNEAEVADYSKLFVPLNYSSLGIRIAMRTDNESFENFAMRICKIALMRQNLLYYEPDDVKIKALNSLVNELAHYYRESLFEVDEKKLTEIKNFVL